MRPDINRPFREREISTSLGIPPRSKGILSCYDFGLIDLLWSSAGGKNGKFTDVILKTAIVALVSAP
jgi:hypothetical protein